MLDPPKEINGKGIPITGMMPIVIPMLTNQWKNMMHATLYPKTLPNVSVCLSARNTSLMSNPT